MDKPYAKRYLLSLLVLFSAGFAVLFALLFALSRSSFDTAIPLTVPRMLLLALLCALVPSGAYCGAVWFLLRLVDRERLNVATVIFLCLFLPVTLAVMTLAGVVLLVPSIVRAVRILRS